MNANRHITMKQFIADLHNHTVLSPCGDVYMSPAEIVRRAKEKSINILGITDHNTTKHCKLVKKIADQHNLFILCGAEVTTKEEIHCLTFFENFDMLNDFQHLLEETITRIPFDPKDFGEQVVVDENEDIIEMPDYLLIAATNLSIEQLSKEVSHRGGIFIPAHITRPHNSIISQLGLIPEDLRYDALELDKNTSVRDFLSKHPNLKNITFTKSSDAHFPEQVGKYTSTFHMPNISFEEIQMALNKKNGRHVSLT